MPADITKSLKRRRLREYVANRRNAESIEQMMARLRARILAGLEGEPEHEQRPRVH